MAEADDVSKQDERNKARQAEIDKRKEKVMGGLKAKKAEIEKAQGALDLKKQALEAEIAKLGGGEEGEEEDGK